MPEFWLFNSLRKAIKGMCSHIVGQDEMFHKTFYVSPCPAWHCFSEINGYFGTGPVESHCERVQPRSSYTFGGR